MDFSTKWKLPHGAAWKDIVPTRYLCDAHRIRVLGSCARVNQVTFCIFVGCLQRKICIKTNYWCAFLQKRMMSYSPLTKRIFTVWFAVDFSSKENRWKIWFFFEVTSISNLFWYIFFFLNSWKYWCCGKYCRCFLLVMSHTHFEDVTHRW